MLFTKAINDKSVLIKTTELDRRVFNPLSHQPGLQYLELYVVVALYDYPQLTLFDS